MVMHTYGKKGSPIILMFHPMGITAEMIYQKIGSRFKGDYEYLIPDFGNHGEEKSDFISAEDEAKKVYNYLKENQISEIALLFGASMGAAVALKLIGYSDIKIKNMYLDGAPLARLGFVMRMIFGPVLVWQKGLYEKRDEKKLKEYIERWGNEINDHMTDCFVKFSKQTIYNIADTCVQGNTPEISNELQENTYMEWGADEHYASSSPKLAKQKYPKAHICVRKGFNHCEYMFKENEKYIEFMESIVERNI